MIQGGGGKGRNQSYTDISNRESGSGGGGGGGSGGKKKKQNSKSGVCAIF